MLIQYYYCIPTRGAYPVEDDSSRASSTALARVLKFRSGRLRAAFEWSYYQHRYQLWHQLGVAPILEQVPVPVETTVTL